MHGRPGTFLPHAWVNAEAVPRFYPNVVTLAHDEAALVEQRSTVDILAKSNLPGRWAVKDSFNKLDLARAGFDVLFEASWIRGDMLVAQSFDRRLQRSSQLAAVLLGHQHGQGIAPRSFQATTETRRAPPPITRLQR